jgi:hypothetical protein
MTYLIILLISCNLLCVLYILELRLIIEHLEDEINEIYKKIAEEEENIHLN